MTLTLLFPYFITSAPNCIDNSHHGCASFDSGSYYVVADSEQGHCNCPCGTRDHTILWKAQGKCIRCGHYRVPKKLPKWVRTRLIAQRLKKYKPKPVVINIKKLAEFGNTQTV